MGLLGLLYHDSVAQTTETYFLTVLEAGSVTSKVPIQLVSPEVTLGGLQGLHSSLLCFHMACPLCMCSWCLSSYKDTKSIALGPHPH